MFQICCITIFTLCSAFSPSNADSIADNWRLAYDLYYGGMRVASINVHANWTPTDYEISTDARSHGVLEPIVRLRSKSNVSGWRQDSEFVPRSYRSQFRSLWGKQSIEMAYANGGFTQVEINPTKDRERPSVGLLERQGAADPLTASVLNMIVFGGSGCGDSGPIFDGRRKYRLVLDPEGDELLDREPRSAYAGPAQKCRIRFEPIAGFSDKELEAAEERSDSSAIVWLAKTDEDAKSLVPVRLESNGSFGRSIAYLREWSTDHKNWRVADADADTDTDQEEKPNN
jgi:hypothetical protein